MKEKITTGTNDQPKNETIAKASEGQPDDSGTIIDVASDGEAKIREEPENEPAQPQSPTEPGDEGEGPHFRSKAEREHIDTEQDGLGLTRRGPDGAIIEEHDQTSDLNKRIDKEFVRSEDETNPSDMPLRGSPD